MSDINAVVIEPLQKFARDSAYLVKKCTKPDRQGAFSLSSAVRVCVHVRALRMYGVMAREVPWSLFGNSLLFHK
jgi:hypothetical protein